MTLLSLRKLSRLRDPRHPVLRGLLALAIVAMLTAFLYPPLAIRAGHGSDAPRLLIGAARMLAQDAEARPERPLASWSSADGVPAWGEPYWGATTFRLSQLGLRLRVAPSVVGRTWTAIRPDETVLEFTAGQTDGIAGVRKDGRAVRETPFWSRGF